MAERIKPEPPKKVTVSIEVITTNPHPQNVADIIERQVQLALGNASRIVRTEITHVL